MVWLTIYVRGKNIALQIITFQDRDVRWKPDLQQHWYIIGSHITWHMGTCMIQPDQFGDKTKVAVVN